MPKHKSPAAYHSLAEQRGFTWLGPLPQNTMGKTGWQCEQGHVWYAPYHNLNDRSGCPLCNPRSHRTDETYFSLAAATGLTWLGPNPPNRDALTNWQCVEGHRWAASYREIAAGQRCAVCTVVHAHKDKITKRAWGIIGKPKKK
jgi:hypothetical protein